MALLKNSLMLPGRLRHAAAALTARRHAATLTEEYARRNYADNNSEYNTVIGSLVAQRRQGSVALMIAASRCVLAVRRIAKREAFSLRCLVLVLLLHISRHVLGLVPPYLLRDAYDDMMLDGVKPERETFHTLIVGTMKGSRLQDALYFRDQMKEMGLKPDVNLYNFLISTCGKCKNSDAAIMVSFSVYLNANCAFIIMISFSCLNCFILFFMLTDAPVLYLLPSAVNTFWFIYLLARETYMTRICFDSYAIVSDMSAAGLGLNKFCYAGLITAFKNKTPTAEETMAKILDFVGQSKGWQYVERVSKDIAENIMMNVSEEELYNLPTAEYVNRRGGFVFKQHTVYHVALQACAELRSKETLEALLEMFNKDNRDGSTYDAYMVMQAMRCYLRCGDIDSAVKMFEEYSSSRSPPAELYAAGGYTTANYVWDLLQSRKITPTLPAVEAYHKGLTAREIPSDDPRLLNVTRVLDNLKLRFGPRRNTQ
ncbi:Pentatricopeptide repeat-containing protein mitochondrial [Zea mays]|uniref:Pentatricopeptide repeat-containing protein mitochondrial n=1 Tax=Zea mays TaxID=4577 RepID=A0A1D6FUL9_MAIZE|nr:Pentatricopeptide repeat-containing protein mitochondrial [Zea mays]